MGCNCEKNRLVNEKLTAIYSGYKQLIFKDDPKLEALAKKRAKICAECQKSSIYGFCRICGCYIPAKTRVYEEKCPYPSENKWKNIK